MVGGSSPSAPTRTSRAARFVDWGLECVTIFIISRQVN
jgi:hypothetical protein